MNPFKKTRIAILIIFSAFIMTSCTKDGKSSIPFLNKESKYYGTYAKDDTSKLIRIGKDGSVLVSENSLKSSGGVPLFRSRINGNYESFQEIKFNINDNNIKIISVDGHLPESIVPYSKGGEVYGALRDMGNEISIEIKGAVFKKIPQSEFENNKKLIEAKIGFRLTDETALDTRTGLMWSRDPFRFPSLPWNEITEVVKTLDYAGYKNWRLPTADEIQVLGNYTLSGDLKENLRFIFYDHSFVIGKYWTSTRGYKNEFNETVLSFVFQQNTTSTEDVLRSKTCWLVRSAK